MATQKSASGWRAPHAAAESVKAGETDSVRRSV